MSIDIQTSLDAVKRQSLLIILKSVTVPYVNLSNKLYDYISTDSSSFSTLLTNLNFNSSVFSSTQVSAMWLLAYLDFYALYVIMVSNITVFNSLKAVSEGKYKYAYNLYKELNRIVGTKKILQDYQYGLYNNFLYPKDINTILSKTSTRNGKIANQLETFPVLTLPAKMTTEIQPTSITFFIEDQTVNEITSDSGLNYLNCQVNRYQNEKISVVNDIVPAKENISYTRIVPEIYGTIEGYFTDKIYVKCVKSTRDESDNPIIEIQGSSNGTDWSSNIPITPETKTAILIEDDIDTGLKIVLYDNCSIAVEDRWIVNIRHANIKPPTINIAVNFGSLEPISYISYLDISSNKLDILSSYFYKIKFSKSKNLANVFDGRIGHIAAIGSALSEYKTILTQNNYEISSKNNKLINAYDFKISEIKGYKCEYEPSGAIVFDSISVENITSLAVEAFEHIPDSGIWESESISNANLQKSFIEFNIVAETTLDTVTIPIPPKNLLKRYLQYFVDTYSDIEEITNGTIDSITDYTIEDSSKSWASNKLIGWKVKIVNSDTNEENIFDIISNTETTLTFSKNTRGIQNQGTQFEIFGIGNMIVVTGENENESKGIFIQDSELEWRKWSESLTGETSLIQEIITPDRIDIDANLEEMGSAYYKQRFPTDLEYKINNQNYSSSLIAYDNSIRALTSYSHDASANSILITEYYWSHSYSIVYPIKLWGIADTLDNNYDNGKWISATSNLYYLYYFDEQNDVHIALRELDQESKILKSFTGNIYGQIEMKSADNHFVTPMVFEYKLECI